MRTSLKDTLSCFERLQPMRAGSAPDRTSASVPFPEQEYNSAGQAFSYLPHVPFDGSGILCPPSSLPCVPGRHSVPCKRSVRIWTTLARYSTHDVSTLIVIYSRWVDSARSCPNPVSSVSNNDCISISSLPGIYHLAICSRPVTLLSRNISRLCLVYR
jgi:hypothetical protein